MVKMGEIKEAKRRNLGEFALNLCALLVGKMEVKRVKITRKFTLLAVIFQLFNPIKCHLGELNFIQSYYKFATKFKKEIFIVFCMISKPQSWLI